MKTLLKTAAVFFFLLVTTAGGQGTLGQQMLVETNLARAPHPGATPDISRICAGSSWGRATGCPEPRIWC